MKNRGKLPTVHKKPGDCVAGFLLRNPQRKPLKILPSFSLLMPAKALCHISSASPEAHQRISWHSPLKQTVKLSWHHSCNAFHHFVPGERERQCFFFSAPASLLSPHSVCWVNVRNRFFRLKVWFEKKKKKNLLIRQTGFTAALNEKRLDDDDVRQ